MQLRNGEVTGRPTPVGVIPTVDELEMDGLEIPPADLDRLLSIDVDRWNQEMAHRAEHLSQFAGLPDEIWQAHHRIAAALRDLATG